MVTQPRSILFKISGPDAPGITAELCSTLANASVGIIDLGQSVIHGLLSLYLEVAAPHSRVEIDDLIRNAMSVSTRLGLKLEVQLLSPRQDTRGLAQHFPRFEKSVVTLLANPITAKCLGQVTHFLASQKLNIDRILPLSRRDTIEALPNPDLGVECVELQLSSHDQVNMPHLRMRLLEIAHAEKVDIAFQKEGVFRRAKRLVVFDMDSTLIQGEVIDELAREAGAYEDVAAITREAMNGQLPFAESLRRRCKKLSDLPVESLERVYARMKLTDGAIELVRVLQRLGYRLALISGGFSFFANKLRERLSLDASYSNELEIQNGRLTGNVLGHIIDAERKAQLLQELATAEGIDLEQVIAIGDGANDVPMLQKAGLGVAFHAKPWVREQADLSLNRDLTSALYLLGYSRQEIEDVLALPALPGLSAKKSAQ